MGLEVIYVVRHGVSLTLCFPTRQHNGHYNTSPLTNAVQYRSNWTTDPLTGTYTSTVRTPTGIPSDPALASYGVKQAEQLGSHLLTLNPPVDEIYSSPFYRCIQTLQPFVEQRASQSPISVTLEQGVGEFYGLARFDHPSPAPLEVLQPLFPEMELRVEDAGPIVVPSVKGEGIPRLHDRLAYALHHLIKRADASPTQPKALLICTHAASIIAIGRALTGRMPEDEGEEDFRCFTCGLSKFVRKAPESAAAGGNEAEVGSWDAETPDDIPNVGWRGGKGVGGGWTCEANSDCSFLDGGEERGW